MLTIRMTKQDIPKEKGFYIIRRQLSAPFIVEVTESGACTAHGFGKIGISPDTLWSEKIEIEGKNPNHHA